MSKLRRGPLHVPAGRCARALIAALLAATLAVPALAAADEEPPTSVLDRTQALRTSQAAVGHAIGDYTLLDREGRPVRLSRYRGKPLLVSFIYTGCFQVCPLTTRALKAAIESGRDVFGTGQFNIVSIGFNQPADSPQALKGFARQHGIDAANWDFLSPPADIVPALTRDFGFTFAPSPAGYDHVLQATLLDRDGRVYRQIYGDELSADAIGEPLQALLRNAPATTGLRIEDIVDRVRILCTVYDPDTGRYRVKYDLVLEIAGGVTFALAMAWFYLAEWLAIRRRRARACPR